ncbi:hypothetical protein Zmor_027464 [Zophobas morio]|uniref:Uncharacterized protein n=1 Tax=Zophobas morio TaxID=2755281 RepID=A0AA38HQ17_9CUCU|nr:hypothetical protein Zmor_027464 [Zophobas morio]
MHALASPYASLPIDAPFVINRRPEKSEYNVVICIGFSAHCLSRPRRVIIKLPVVVVIKAPRHAETGLALSGAAAFFLVSKAAVERLRAMIFSFAISAASRRPIDVVIGYIGSTSKT